MTPTPLVKFAIGVVLAVLLLFGVSLLYERSRGTTPAQLDTARAHTQAAGIIAAKAETVFVEKATAAGAARKPYRASRDSALRHITDTLLVKETITRADTVIARDSAALAAASTTIAAQKAVTDSVRKELALAMRPHFAPRLSGSASGLYDAIAQVPAASLAGNFRVIGRVSLTAQYHQRFTPGEKPRFYTGVSLAF